MFQRNPFYTNPEPCLHLSDYKLKHGFSGYKAIQKLLVSSPIGRTSLKKPSLRIPRCSYCNGVCEKRFFLCLICSSFSCLDHTLLHPKTETGHDLFVDVERGELFCGLCCDQIYDPDFDQVVMAKHSVVLPQGVVGNESIGQRLIKRRRLVSGVGLYLNDKSKFSFPAKDLRGKSCFPEGLRGLNNLGSTCFMNCMLQALLHAPIFKDYFLSDGHDSEDCKRRTMNRLCLICDINAVFSAMYSGDQSPYSPARFLYRSAIMLYVITLDENLDLIMLCSGLVLKFLYLLNGETCCFCFKLVAAFSKFSELRAAGCARVFHCDVRCNP